ncbi:histidine phosphatase family protein [Bifidobacterium leontopitheci]|uniref:Phosphoglycerate mutase family protein n=1 Tax=Bifidobacterium leontopitheci TaxID=2650774 RepID=A0A6I1GH62_9BIFI|nr:histidine phosphatase family protein [Bifidobacterium leontopitheci]KAB7791004.1 phosphoglycerate mutase family protein [Bifidobacterium leontopitheci]
MIDEVVFLRHGRTSYNLARRLQGQIDVPLDIVGQWQADQSAYELARRYYWAKVSTIAEHPERLAQPGPDAAARSDIGEYRDAPAARRRMVVVSSDLFRAQQTAHAFADLLGLPVRLDPRLRERSFGQWEGMTREEIRADHADAYDSWRAHKGGELAFGVESRKATGERGAAAVLDYVNDPRYADSPTPTTLMLVGHGSWHVATVETLLGMDPDNLSNLGGMRNAFWTTLTPQRHAGGTVTWTMTGFNQGPAIAGLCDWENGPDDLRHGSMAAWKPITA